MPSCVFRQCSNYTATVRDRDISFHTLPKDGLMKEKWLRVIRRQRREEAWMPTPYSSVCSDHFVKCDIYTTGKNLRRLKKTAVPVIEGRKKFKEENDRTSSPNSLEDVGLSDEDSIFDNPMKAYLEEKLQKVSEDKRQLQLKNYYLTRRNKKLKEKCKKLKQMLSEVQTQSIDCDVVYSDATDSDAINSD